MPATRSRTENWRQSLEAIADKGGSIEISIDAEQAHTGPSPNASLIWRVRVVELTEDEIIVEQPAAAGRQIDFETGARLIGIISIGQNRWMFQTENLGKTFGRGLSVRTAACYRLRLPSTVERCQRRNFYRISTGGIALPHVDCYGLTRPDSLALAEAASRAEILERRNAAFTSTGSSDRLMLPEFGAEASASMVNIGGGGLGLLIDPQNRGPLEAHSMFWLRVHLEPAIPAPLGVAARLRHTHVDSSQRLYAGLSFEFGSDGQHQSFIAEQIAGYVSYLQREQAPGMRTAA